MNLATVHEKLLHNVPLLESTELLCSSMTAHVKIVSPIKKMEFYIGEYNPDTALCFCLVRRYQREKVLSEYEYLDEIYEFDTNAYLDKDFQSVPFDDLLE